MLISRTKAHRLVQQFEAYLQEVLGVSLKVKKWSGDVRLPAYLRDQYAFYQTKILEDEAVLMLVKGETEPSPVALAKHMLKVREKWEHDVIFLNEAASRVDRKRMMERKIPFVIPGNQMYLPILGMDLREHFKKIHTHREGFSPSTQVLVLDAIYRRKENSYTPTESAKRFGYSIMTMSRAFDELEQAGIGEYTVRGKERCLQFPEMGKNLWEAALPHLKSPVRKMLYVLGYENKVDTILSGFSALAVYTDLAEPENRILAIDHGDRKLILQSPNLEVVNQPEPGAVEIELWSYPPALFARDNLADRLSLFLSLEAKGDERIEAAKEQLLEEMKW